MKRIIIAACAAVLATTTLAFAAEGDVQAGGQLMSQRLPGKCLSLVSQQVRRDPLRMDHCTSSQAQQWTVGAAAHDGYSKIYSVGHRGRCLGVDALDASVAVAAPCADLTNQGWRVESTGSGRSTLQSHATGNCLGIRETVLQNELDVKSCKAVPGQAWTLPG